MADDLAVQLRSMVSESNGLLVLATNHAWADLAFEPIEADKFVGKPLRNFMLLETKAVRNTRIADRIWS